MTDRFDPDRIRGALGRVLELLAATAAGVDAHAAAIARVPMARRASARNLAHYLAMRSQELRPLQRQLAELSLSSLGRMEGNVFDTLDGVRRVMMALLGERAEKETGPADVPSLVAAESLLDANADLLLGPPAPGRQTRIMVNLPTEAAGSSELVRGLLQAGVELLRINLARDDEPLWTAMAQNVRAVERELGCRCRIFADLPGPKLRTGDLEEGPCVVRVRPGRDALGLVTQRARIAFRDPGAADPGAEPAGDDDASASVPLTRPMADEARPGDELVVTDTRGRVRRCRVEAVQGGSCRTSVDRTVYLGTGCQVELRRRGERRARSRIGNLPARPGWIPLRPGDTLLVTRAQEPGCPATIDDETGAAAPARVPCTLPEAFAAVSPGQRVLFDDGRIAGVIETCTADAMCVRITAVPPHGGRLRAHRGINLPDTELPAGLAGEGYLPYLDWVAAHADVVGMSFVQHAVDVHRLHEELCRLGKPGLGIVLKVETARAFDNLPELLFAALCNGPAGVLVARGDLAVEVGYERLAEVQEEILWLAEAAHLPVIWATQVLDSMAKTGMPSRAEVTDAAMGGRSECVMLNKGPHVVATARFLANVLGRMQQHHRKKRSLLRRLRVAGPSQTVL